MKGSMIEFCISLATVLAMTLSSAGTAAAQNNTAFGTGALASPSSPDLADSAFGFKALHSPTSGLGNTAIGTQALEDNTTGTQNTATGWNALSLNTTGFSNTASGLSALFNNTTGSNNTASGVFALSDNTTKVKIALALESGVLDLKCPNGMVALLRFDNEVHPN